jgi:hypothetical protein
MGVATGSIEDKLRKIRLVMKFELFVRQLQVVIRVGHNFINWSDWDISIPGWYGPLRLGFK